MTKHDDHMEAAMNYWEQGGIDELLYVSRPSPTSAVRYVWTSGVRLGLAASVQHLNDLLLLRPEDEDET